MATQETINKIQDILRAQYILLKDEEIRRILALYGGSVDYFLELMLSNPDFQKGRIDQQFVYDTLDKTTPAIEDGFRIALGRMFDIGASSLLIAMTSIDQKIGKQSGTKITQLLNTGAERLLRQGGAAGSAFAQFNTSTSTARQIKANPNNLKITLSSNIWDINRKNELIAKMQEGFRNGLSPYNVALSVKQYSIKGNGFSNAYRLISNELVHAKSVAQVESARAWNNDPESKFKLLIEQYLSATHHHVDICDSLVGVYDPSKPVPKIPRHIRCECGQRFLIDNAENRKRVTTIEERLRASENQQDILYKGLVTQSKDYYNSRLEFITQNLKGNEQQQALQDLANTIDENDPVGKTVGQLLEKYYGIKKGEIQVGLNQQEKDFLRNNGVNITNTPLDDTEALGAYDVKDNTLYINPKVPMSEAAPTIIHEFAHAVDANLSKVNNQLLSFQSDFNNNIRTPSGSLTSDGIYIITKRALGLSGDDGIKISRYILGGEDVPANLKLMADNLKDYYLSPQEMFAEGYMLYRTDSNFKELAPNLYRYYNSLGNFISGSSTI